ncbi:hypothetical protein V7S43_014295 [Phytophthora oleae]|uniref:Uncharacterized protein n=1 Tax=Phytophthora oleae TaxID=2107226 RepID=A0ABD3F2Q0_9STRA
MDPIVLKADGGLAEAVPTILAPNSPYGSHLQRIYDGEQLNFSAPKREGQSVLLSDASVDNWVTLKKTVACDEWPTTYYPIGFKDEYSGVKTL